MHRVPGLAAPLIPLKSLKKNAFRISTILHQDANCLMPQKGILHLQRPDIINAKLAFFQEREKSSYGIILLSTNTNHSKLILINTYIS